MSRKPNFRIVNAGGPPTIYMYDTIGPSWAGLIGADMVRDELDALGNASLVRVCINSDGGDVFEGFAIYNLLNKHPARIEVEVDGIAASIAGIIAMAGDEIRFAENAYFMCHRAKGCTCGEVGEIEDYAQFLEGLDETLAKILSNRSGSSLEDVRAWMEATTYMTAEQALEHGFADKVVAGKRAENHGFSFERFAGTPPQDLVDRGGCSPTACACGRTPATDEPLDTELPSPRNTLDARKRELDVLALRIGSNPA